MSFALRIACVGSSLHLKAEERISCENMLLHLVSVENSECGNRYQVPAIGGGAKMRALRIAALAWTFLEIVNEDSSEINSSRGTEERAIQLILGLIIGSTDVELLLQGAGGNTDEKILKHAEEWTSSPPFYYLPQIARALASLLGHLHNTIKCAARSNQSILVLSHVLRSLGDAGDRAEMKSEIRDKSQSRAVYEGFQKLHRAQFMSTVLVLHSLLLEKAGKEMLNIPPNIHSQAIDALSRV